MSFCSSIPSHKMLYFAFSWHTYRGPFNSHSLHKCCCWPSSSLYDHTGPQSSSHRRLELHCTQEWLPQSIKWSIFWMQALTKHWRWPPPKIFFFFVFLSFNRRVTVIDPRWPPTGSVSGVCGDALVVKRKCSVSLFYSVWCETPHVFEQRPSRLLFDPPARVAWPGCARLYCAECVYVWKLGSVALDLPNLEVASGTPHTHVQTRQCARPAESAPMLIISVCSRFLKTQTDPPTRTGGKDQVTLSQFFFI